MGEHNIRGYIGSEGAEIAEQQASWFLGLERATFGRQVLLDPAGYIPTLCTPEYNCRAERPLIPIMITEYSGILEAPNAGELPRLIKLAGQIFETLGYELVSVRISVDHRYKLLDPTDIGFSQKATYDVWPYILEILDDGGPDCFFREWSNRPYGSSGTENFCDGVDWGI